LAVCYRTRADGIDIFVRLTPRAASDSIDGVAAAADGSAHLAVRVRAVPEKGAANKALEALIAAEIGVPRRAVSVVAGSTARLKTVRVVAGDPVVLVQRIEALAAKRQAVSPRRENH